VTDQIPDDIEHASTPPVILTKRELAQILDLAAQAVVPLGQAFQFHDVLVRAQRLASGDGYVGEMPR
jgi:hypothetical protein